MAIREIFPVKFYQPGENTNVTKDFRPITVPSSAELDDPKAKTSTTIEVTPESRTTTEQDGNSKGSEDSSLQEDSTGNEKPPVTGQLLPPPL